MKEAITKIVGLHIAGGDVHAAIVDKSGVMADEFTIMKLSPTMEPAAAVLDFTNRLRQQLRRIQPATVALMNTSRYRGWPWAQAADRARLEALIMLACAELTVAYRLVRQEDAARILGVPRTDFARGLAGVAGTQGWRAWKDRAVALAAALTVQREAGEPIK